MPQNVEVKAKVGDLEALILKAKNLCKCEGTIIVQDDTFFKTETGRLKLRIFKVICYTFNYLNYSSLTLIDFV